MPIGYACNRLVIAPLLNTILDFAHTHTISFSPCHTTNDPACTLPPGDVKSKAACHLHIYCSAYRLWINRHAMVFKQNLASFKQRDCAESPRMCLRRVVVLLFKFIIYCHGCAYSLWWEAFCENFIVRSHKPYGLLVFKCQGALQAAWKLPSHRVQCNSAPGQGSRSWGWCCLHTQTHTHPTMLTFQHILMYVCTHSLHTHTQTTYGY